MRNVIVVLVLFLGAAFVYLSFGELETILETLQKGNLWYILLAAFLQGGWFLTVGATYHALYHMLGMTGAIHRLALLAAAANFVNIVAPSAGMGGMAVFITDARRNGGSSGKATVAGMLSVFLDYLAFLCVLAMGLIVLFRRDDLDPPELAASGVILLIAILLGLMLYLGSKSAQRLGNALAGMARLVNRILHPLLKREYLSEARAHEFARDMAENLQALPGNWRRLLKPLFFALLNKALLMCVLTAAFLAFRVPFTTGTIVGGFAIAYLFLIVSPTPAGIGIVEGVMPLALTSLRVPWSQAVIITLAYRGITFWLPLGIGALAFRTLNRRT
jgi:uncharacterized protein (TIRG00374 family)